MVEQPERVLTQPIRPAVGTWRLWTTGVLLLACGCVHTPREVGRPPDGRRRPYGVEDTTRRADPATTNGSEHVVREDRRMVGVHSTGVFHRPDCPLLEEVAPDDRIPFVSSFDSLDAGLRPCTTCESAPR